MSQEIMVYQYVAKRVAQLSTGPGGQKADLAELRRGIGKMPGEDPRLWGEFLLELPPDLYGRYGEPSRGEWAVYTALTLFALHQQGRDPSSEPVNRKGQTLGKAAAGLAVNGDMDTQEKESAWERALQRLYLVASAPNIQELAYHLRGLVQLLRAKGIGLDYPALAADLCRWQDPLKRDQVKLKWGQEFYGERFSSGEEKEETT